MNNADNQTVVLASGNAGKIRELSTLLGDLGLQVKPQKAYGVGDADETGLSFIENAILKARHASAHTNLPAIADDSGIEVDALMGEPGIYSARFSGEGATDETNNQKLLDRLKDIPTEKRQARFQCALVYMRHAADPSPVIAQASWEGSILHEPHGENGFGYDPLFWVDSHQCSSAQLDKAVKNGISHRAQALQSLIAQLRQRVNINP